MEVTDLIMFVFKRQMLSVLSYRHSCSEYCLSPFGLGILGNSPSSIGSFRLYPAVRSSHSSIAEHYKGTHVGSAAGNTDQSSSYLSQSRDDRKGKKGYPMKSTSPRQNNLVLPTNNSHRSNSGHASNFPYRQNALMPTLAI